MRYVQVSDFLTPEEIALALELSDAASITKLIILPNLERINASLGQENDARYLGYATEYAIRQYKNTQGPGQ